MKILTFFLLSLMQMHACAQKEENAYVRVEKAFFYASPDKNSEKVATVYRYDNLKVLEKVNASWYKVEWKGKTAYAELKVLGDGRAVVRKVSGRVGAICKDGSRSSATGRGACSHHGGVQRWLVEDREVVDIITN